MSRRFARYWLEKLSECKQFHRIRMQQNYINASGSALLGAKRVRLVVWIADNLYRMSHLIHSNVYVMLRICNVMIVTWWRRKGDMRTWRCERGDIHYDLNQRYVHWTWTHHEQLSDICANLISDRWHLEPIQVCLCCGAAACVPSHQLCLVSYRNVMRPVIASDLWAR